MRMARQADAAPLDRESHLEAISMARASCTAGLASVFDEVRAHAGANIVVLWDPDRMTFPFFEVSDLDVILLRPGSRVYGMDCVPGGSQVTALVEHDVESLLHRVRVWGIDNDRVFPVLEDDVDTIAGYRDLVDFLGADASDETVSRLLARRAVGLVGAD